MKYYTQKTGKVVETDRQFKHVMAVALNPATNYTDGVIRCITSRTGDVAVKGFIDRSELHTIKNDWPLHFTIGDRLPLKNEGEIVEKLRENDRLDFIGLEDPDIFIDETTGLTHLYFTMPFIPPDKKEEDRIRIHMGHAVGKNLDSLEMTMPVLMSNDKASAKELSIAPINSKGFRYNLIESRERRGATRYSTVQVAIARDMGKNWEYGQIAFHPADKNISWIGGHASPGPLFPPDFIDIGKNKRLGIINGREADQHEGGEIKYGIFSVGLFIYDFEEGRIDWVSPEPLIQDSEARTITFASQFVLTEKGKGVLYAHVDDSFVRAYDLEADMMRFLLP